MLITARDMLENARNMIGIELDKKLQEMDHYQMKLLQTSFRVDECRKSLREIDQILSEYKGEINVWKIQ